VQDTDVVEKYLYVQNSPGLHKPGPVEVTFQEMAPEEGEEPKVVKFTMQSDDTVVEMRAKLGEAIGWTEAEKRRAKFLIRLTKESFGSLKDHEKVQAEWNAFCELRHPIFSRLIEDIGPMDGSVPGVPDRRIHALHPLYRDAAGPVLVLDTLTNGPADATWFFFTTSLNSKKAAYAFSASAPFTKDFR